jgi:hypothetical protein
MQRDWKSVSVCFLIEGIVLLLMASNFIVSSFRPRGIGREPKSIPFARTND